MKATLNFFKRLFLCTFTYHNCGYKVQSHKEFHIYSCSRCGNMFTVTKDKYK